MSERSKVVAVFDFDGTLCRGFCGFRFFRRVQGAIPFALFCLREIVTLFSYRWHFRDEPMLRRITRIVFRGRTLEFLRGQASIFADEDIPRYLNESVFERAKWHQEKGHRCVIASRSYAVFLEVWGQRVGFDDVIATELVFDEGGVCTGAMAGESCRGAGKVERLHELLGNRREHQVVVYTDSVDDQALLDDADHGYLIEKIDEFTRLERDDRPVIEKKLRLN